MFPTTRGSVLAALKGSTEAERARARETVAAAYWRPACAYLRVHWRMREEDAQDAVQSFFASALERDVLERFEPGRAAFRTFLRACLDNHVRSALRAESREKRGGGAVLESTSSLGPREPAGGDDPDEIFRREWVRSVFTLGVRRLRERLEAEGRGAQFELLRRRDLDPAEGAEQPSYAQLAAALNLSTTQVTNHLAAARRELRAELTEILRELTGSDEDLRAESRALFGDE